MGVVIRSVEPASPAFRSGIRPGFTLLRINGHEIVDVLDYRFYMVERVLTLDLLDESGAPLTCTVSKGEYEELGPVFDTYLMDREKHCKNRCVFCFIDQLPGGLRESLYFKDDDSRLSFLFGNYITLTNLTEHEARRIIDMHISPVNISVHTTNPELRVRMMKNPGAGGALAYIPRFFEAGIKMNAQLVLAPGINDGDELSRSLQELSRFAPEMQSVSAVPVGLTKYRADLPELRLFSPEEARAVIEVIDGFGQRMLEEHGQRIFYASDEFYLTAGLSMPDHDHYGEFHQLENGVGMSALLAHEFRLALDGAESPCAPRRVTIATGAAAYPLISGLAEQAMALAAGLEIEVIPIRNDFFGETITVAGLVCGGDLIRQLSGRALGDELLFPAAMLRHERDLFLDSLSVEDVARALGTPVRAVENDGFELLDAMLGIRQEQGLPEGGFDGLCDCRRKPQ